MEFSEKIILITGAASGIGEAAASAFAAEGGTVIVSDINVEKGLKTVEKIRKSGHQSHFIETDVSDFSSVESMVEAIFEQFGRLDIAINNAGINAPQAKTGDTELEAWHRVMSVNASGVFYCMKTQLRKMEKQGGGVILNIASVAGLRGLPNHSPYVASKHAVVGLTKTAAMEYARKNIRINALCPVYTITPLFDPEAIDQMSAGLSEKLKAFVPMKRFAEPMEQVHAMLWLCSEKAGFVTGLAMPVDGGLTA